MTAARVGKPDLTNVTTPAAPWWRDGLIRRLPTAGVVLWAASSIALSLTGATEIVEAVDKLGYPSYTPELIGYAKLAGLIAFLAPVPPRLREWAYAGFCFELGAAVISYVAAGYPAEAVPPAMIALVVLASWRLRQRPALIAKPG